PWPFPVTAPKSSRSHKVSVSFFELNAAKRHRKLVFATQADRLFTVLERCILHRRPSSLRRQQIISAIKSFYTGLLSLGAARPGIAAFVFLPALMNQGSETRAE